MAKSVTICNDDESYEVYEDRIVISGREVTDFDDWEWDTDHPDECKGCDGTLFIEFDGGIARLPMDEDKRDMLETARRWVREPHA